MECWVVTQCWGSAIYTQCWELAFGGYVALGGTQPPRRVKRLAKLVWRSRGNIDPSQMSLICLSPESNKHFDHRERQVFKKSHPPYSLEEFVCAPRRRKLAFQSPGNLVTEIQPSPVSQIPKPNPTTELGNGTGLNDSKDSIRSEKNRPERSPHY
jgi:hypothetical protein